MILTLDIGNTTIGVNGAKRVYPDDYRVVFGEKIPTAKTDLYDALRAVLERADVSPREIEGAALSSVVPRSNEPIVSAAKRLIGNAPVQISAKCCKGLKFGVEDPSRLGSDRLADSAWAAERYALPAVTVDMGTATTFNVIDENRVFLGGLIAPGTETSLTALSKRAAQLPALEASAPPRLIGKNTEECMLSGAVTGAAAMIDGITARVESELGKTASLIITGGWAAVTEGLCLHPHVFDPLLLPKGLAFLYDCAIGSDF